MTELAAMPRYEAYKDSGVEWLGEIPEHWEVNRLKAFIKTLDSGVSVNASESEVAADGDIGVLKTSCVYQYSFNPLENKKVFENEIKRVNCPVKAGSIIISRMNAPELVGASGFVKKDHDNLFLPDRLWQTSYRNEHSFSPEWLSKVLVSTRFRGVIETLATGTSPSMKNITKGDFLGIYVATPSREEQIAIASFIRKKQYQIDQAVAIKEKQIELLKERRQILIQNTVTRGLDPQAPVRDSGVEWIGEIPAHWEVKRAKYLFNEVDERSVDGKEELLSVSHMTGVTPRSEKNVSMFMAEDYTGSKTCQKDDLVFNIMWTWMGALGVTDRPGIVSSSYGIFRQQKAGSVNPKYLEYLLKTTKYIEHYNRVSTGLHSSRLRFYGHMFFDMELGFPDRKEQDQIIEHVEVEAFKIDKAITLQQQQIHKLKEYRATLINSAVTGKIKVPVVG